MDQKLTLIVQQSNRDQISRLREGLGNTVNIAVLGMLPRDFWTVAGIDALYLTLSAAERFGSRPLPPHEVAVLPTGKEDRDKGLPPFILTGMVLNETDPETAEFCVPLLAAGILRAAAEVNRTSPGAIRCVGLFEFEVSFLGADYSQIGRLLAESLGVS